MLVVVADGLFGDAQEAQARDNKPAFLKCLAGGGKLGALAIIDLATDNIPVTGFGRVHAPV